MKFASILKKEVETTVECCILPQRHNTVTQLNTAGTTTFLYSRTDGSFNEKCSARNNGQWREPKNTVIQKTLHFAKSRTIYQGDLYFKNASGL